MTGGLVAGDEQLDQEHAELVVAELLAVDLDAGEHRDDVVGGRPGAVRRPAPAARRSSR